MLYSTLTSRRPNINSCSVNFGMDIKWRSLFVLFKASWHYTHSQFIITNCHRCIQNGRLVFLCVHEWNLTLFEIAGWVYAWTSVMLKELESYWAFNFSSTFQDLGLTWRSSELKTSKKLKSSTFGPMIVCHNKVEQFSQPTKHVSVSLYCFMSMDVYALVMEFNGRVCYTCNTVNYRIISISLPLYLSLSWSVLMF